MKKLNLSFKPSAVKADTLLFAPEGWFSVRGYLSHTFRDFLPQTAWASYLDILNFKIFHITEGKLPSEKALSIRLFRYFKQGLVDRKRDRHQFLYKVTEKGHYRGMLLVNRYESVYKFLPHPPYPTKRKRRDINEKQRSDVLDRVVMGTHQDIRDNTIDDSNKDAIREKELNRIFEEMSREAKETSIGIRATTDEKIKRVIKDMRQD